MTRRVEYPRVHECLECGRVMQTENRGQLPLTCSPICKQRRKERRLHATGSTYVQGELFKPAHYVHGTVYLYKKRGCRCGECRAAATLYSASNSKGRCIRCNAPTMSGNPTPICHACRKVAPFQPSRQSLCETCGCEASVLRRVAYSAGLMWMKRKYCSDECRIAARPEPKRVDPYHNRARRAPGLSSHHRLKLLRKWKRQGRSCFYCDAAPTCVDHVVPLVSGGSNWEGNLVPSCHRCNARKGRLFITEWRLRDGKAQAA